MNLLMIIDLIDIPCRVKMDADKTVTLAFYDHFLLMGEKHFFQMLELMNEVKKQYEKNNNI